MRGQLLIVVEVSFVFSWSAYPVNPVCSVPSVEVLLSVAVVALVNISCVPPTLLREEVRVLLNMEGLVVLMSMEASIIASQLRILLHTIFESAETILFIRTSIIARVIALVLLHRQMSILLSRNILPCDIIIIAS